MNYLAHLFLAENNPDSRLGNLLGDFVKGPIQTHQGTYSPAILHGIQMHRRIDRFTDRHPRHCQSRRRVSPTLRHFAGVAVDIYYDHFLACHWSKFSEQSREAFVAEIYALLDQRQAELPPRLRQMVTHIITEDWLNGYAHLPEIHRTFARLTRRTRRPNALLQASELLHHHYSALEQDFLTFFPSLIQYGRSLHLNTQ